MQGFQADQIINEGEIKGCFGMSLMSSFTIGTIVKNADMVTEFKCGNMGGMCHSHATNILVIISDHTKSLYDDKLFGDRLHYTGMGKNDDQNINFGQNKTLKESSMNVVDVHLFEVLIEGQYIYKGQIDLIESLYQEVQKGHDGLQRNVCIFRVRGE